MTTHLRTPAPIICIDGPTASGKGTVARAVADVLGFRYLDSGALYRLTGFAARQSGADMANADEIGTIARNLAAKFVGDKIYFSGFFKNRNDLRRLAKGKASGGNNKDISFARRHIVKFESTEFPR